ncbi:MAG TPA: site-2 protease family protein [Balneolaceae bacterium]|nr:site-2 protease family protein [Balneolaceae bacterium]
MKGSLTLGKFAGIKVRIHWSFWLIIVWIIFLDISRGNDITGMMWNILFIFSLFFCVVLHEFGHALTARKFNIGTRQITLLPIGGVASLEEMPENPWEEFLVAIAGPLVNVGIAIILYLFIPVESFLEQDPEALQESLSMVNSGNFLFFLLSANILLVAFNLIPAFPMDGGRVLRALLSTKLDRVKATQAASLLGQMLAFFFFIIGLLYNPILILIAIFVWFGAQGENVMIQQMSLLKDHEVREAMMTDFTELNPDSTVDDVVDLIIAGTERDFVVTENGKVRGIVKHSDINDVLRNRGKNVSVREFMKTDFTELKASEKLTDIYRKIRVSQNDFFPVVENGEIKGVIDMNNINEFMMFRSSADY